MALERILVPVDGSAGSVRAIELALDLARLSGGSLTVLEVIEEFGPLPGRYEAAPAGKERVTWLADQRFEPVVDLLEKSGVAYTRRVEEGYAPETICQVAESEKSDLVVIGSRGLTAVGRFLIGSVSDRVVHHAPCSVLVVR